MGSFKNYVTQIFWTVRYCNPWYSHVTFEWPLWPFIHVCMWDSRIVEVRNSSDFKLWQLHFVSFCYFFCFFIYFFHRFWSFYRAAERLHWSFLFLATSSTYLPTCNHIVNIITSSIKSGSSTVFTPSHPFLQGRLSLRPNFQKGGGGLTGSQFLKGGCWEKGMTLFSGGAVFTWKIN